ncbi:MAG TPA: hypothetical protein VLB51_13725 [Methylomirabilota bacterium]|nr:hypothetical protein [Methylomirabilota bacterium]
MHRALMTTVVAVLLAAGAPAHAQTSQPGDAIDLEIFNPVDGSNTFCVTPSEAFEARVYFRPGTATTSCILSCSPPAVPGGSANVATAVIDVAFDPTALSYVPASLVSNSNGAAAHGLGQEQNAGSGRIGWALAGSWSDPGNPASTLLSPCDMELLTAPGWLFAFQLQATGEGSSVLHLRRQTDDPPFALSLADICGSAAFTLANDGLDEVVDAMVLVSDSCSSLIFFDGFETGGSTRWSGTIQP